jgi:hypothetical protein
MPMSRLKAPCRVCGEAAFKWYDPMGFVHVECIPVEWFESYVRRMKRGLPPPGPEILRGGIEPPPF